MMFEVDVGNVERHRVFFSFSKVTGRVRIKIDYKEVISKLEIWPPTKKPFTFLVGDKEKHNIRIQMERPFWFAMFRKWDFRVFEDNKEIKRLKG